MNDEIIASNISKLFQPEIILFLLLTSFLIIDYEIIAYVISLLLICVVVSLARSKLILKDNSQKGRTTSYIITIMSYIICCIVMFIYFKESVYALSAYSVTFGAILLYLSNHIIKISVHCGTVSLAVTLFSYSFSPIGFVSFLIIPVIIWSRLKLRSHSITESVAGTLVGVISTTIIYIVT